MNLSRDFGRCGPSTAARLREVATNPATWAVLGYRYRRWAATRRLPWPARKLLGASAMAAEVAAQVLTGVSLSARSTIGPGLSLPHAGTIVVGPRVSLGRDCTIAHNVTLGHAGGGGRSSGIGPTVGDRVYIGPGSILIGPIVVGDDALIGAGAVVTRSVPPRGVVAGNPARLLSRRGSFDLIAYPGMDADPARRLARAEAEADREVAV